MRTAYQEWFGVGRSLDLVDNVDLPLPSGVGGVRFWSFAPDSAGWQVRLPDATRCRTGADVVTIHNAGIDPLMIADADRNDLLELQPDEVACAHLLDNASTPGQWVLDVRTGAASGSPLTVGRVPLVLHITQDLENLNLRTWADSIGYDGVTPAALQVLWQGAYVIGSASASLPALDTGSWPTGSTNLMLIAGGGVITGMGGAGGRGGDVPPGLLSQPGNPGGTGLKVRLNTALVSYGKIQGGGGGGGGGAYSGTRAGGGGGGGAGKRMSQGGNQGTGGGAQDGYRGAIDLGGSGGQGGNDGGSGGQPGQSGANGAGGGAAGGAAGDAIQRATAVTLTKIRAGTITGAETTF